MRLQTHNAHVRPLRSKLTLEDFRHHGSLRNFRLAELHLLARKQSQLLQFAEQIVVSGIAKGFFKALAHPAFKGFRQGRSSSGGMKGHERREAGNVEIFWLCK